MTAIELLELPNVIPITTRSLGDVADLEAALILYVRERRKKEISRMWWANGRVGTENDAGETRWAMRDGDCKILEIIIAQ